MSDVWNVHLSYSFAVAEILSNNHLYLYVNYRYNFLFILLIYTA